ncbi:MAG: amidohydrolase family protein [Anaerolineae bacterium]|nr:amidohydrolase family protein [Anaerolineae bacterium]
MQPATIILTNGIVVTMDRNFTVVDPGAVVIQGDNILEVGPAAEITAKYDAAEVVDCRGKAIIPGLVNAHTHVPMTLLRGLADDLRLDVWLMGYMMPTEQHFVDPNFVDLGTRLACAEMLLSGVTTFADMYYFEDSVANATAEIGMRAICGQTVLKFPTPDAPSYEAGLERCREFILKWKGSPLIVPAVSPHAPYTSTPEMLEACASLAIEHDVPVHTHIAEMALEQENSRRDYGMPVVPWFKKYGLLDAKVIAAHCVHVDQGEIRTLQRHNVGVSHNPSSNMKLASGIAPVRAMLEAGLNVGIGTDGPASNNDLDMFEEVRLAALLAKVATDNPTTLPAREVFSMATIGGARALHIDHLTGSLEAGKRADIAVVDMHRIHNWPYFNRDPQSIYSRLIYASNSHDVQHVICNGRWLLRDRHLLTIDADEVMSRAQALAGDIDTFIVGREGNILSKLLAIGELEQRESFEVQVKARITNTTPVERLLERPDVTIIKASHYRQHDTYFEFPEKGYRVRHREDDTLDPSGQISSVRARLTLTAAKKEREFAHAVVLSHSQFISDATRPLRFYREYLQAPIERQLSKDRQRWHIDYHGARFYINIDRLLQPDGSLYFEIKSTTWSRKDAEEKAQVITDLLHWLGIADTDLVTEEYIAL